MCRLLASLCGVPSGISCPHPPKQHRPREHGNAGTRQPSLSFHTCPKSAASDTARRGADNGSDFRARGRLRLCC